MENWYLPMTIIPGLGLLILSTSNLLLSLSNELTSLLNSKDKDQTIINKKLKQLKLLNITMVFFYVAVAFLLGATLVGGVLLQTGKSSSINILISIAAIISSLLGLISLVVYSFRAVKIRQDQFKN